MAFYRYGYANHWFVGYGYDVMRPIAYISEKQDLRDAGAAGHRRAGVFAFLFLGFVFIASLGMVVCRPSSPPFKFSRDFQNFRYAIFGSVRAVMALLTLRFLYSLPVTIR